MYCVCSSVRHTPPTTAACTTPSAAPAATSRRWCRPSRTRLEAFVNVSSLSRYPEMGIGEHYIKTLSDDVIQERFLTHTAAAQATRAGQSSRGRGRTIVPRAASMVARVAWPEGKLNLSTSLTVAYWSSTL